MDEGLRRDLLAALVQPENIGDLHLKMMVSDSKLYPVDKNIVEYLIQAVYESIWDS